MDPLNQNNGPNEKNLDPEEQSANDSVCAVLGELPFEEQPFSLALGKRNRYYEQPI